MTTLHKKRVENRVQVPPSQVPDVREQPVGRFLGRVPPDAPIGSFGNVRPLRREGRGTFRGDAARQRQGSFGDHDLSDRESARHERFLRTPDAA